MVQKERRPRLKKIGKLLYIMIAAFIAIVAFAEEVTVTASVDRNQMRPGDTFTYSISITAQGATNFDQPKLPDLSSFDVLSTWSGSEMRGTFVNGQVQTQRSQTFNYMLSAKSEGVFTIGAAEVTVNGQLMRSNPIQIQISAQAPQGGPSPRAGRRQTDQEAMDQIDQAEEDLFSQLLNRKLRPGPRAIQPADPNEAFFIHVETDKTKVYQGEQVIASWYLVTRSQIADIDTLKYPSLSGFWKEDIEVATRLNFQPVVINGLQYQKALLASYALFPIKAGEGTIDSYKAKCRVISHSLLGLPRDSQVVKESEAIKIEVMDLPAQGAFATFSGGVGEFTISAKVDATEVKANVPLTLRVRIEGQGNAKVVDFPKLALPETVQVYDTKNEMKFFPNGRSYKEFETLIVPKAAGEFKIPAMSFVFFNPKNKSYYEKTTEEFLIKVNPSDGDQIISSTNLESADIKNIEKKLVLPGLILAAEERASFSTAEQVGVWGLLFVLSGLGLSGYAYKQVGKREKRENLKRQVRRRIAEIETLLDKGDWRKVGVDSTNLVYSVLAEIAGLGGASFEFDKLVEKAPPSFKRSLAPQIKILMSKLEVVGFAPESVVGKWKEKKELKSLVAETEKILSEATKYDFTSQEYESIET